MSEVTTVKTIKKTFDSYIKASITWFKFISAINNIKLTSREIELLAYINYRGTISSLSSKQEFCMLFGSSQATISNMVSKKLLPKKLVIKDKGRIKINPALFVDFSKELVVRLFMDVNINVNDINDKQDKQDGQNRK